MTDFAAGPLFNPRARVSEVPLFDDQVCHVIDDALLEPERWVAWAAARREAFKAVDFNAYPGIYLMMPPAVESALRACFDDRIRRHFDARRLLQVHCRLSMVTLAPQRLRPYQWLCHTDRAGLDAEQSIQASVLYLFDAPELGGTSFYVPARPRAEIAALFDDATRLGAAAFSRRHGIEPGYMRASNAWFTRVASVPARWNRLIFYDGAILHSGDIVAPERLSDDPQRGRLTFNGFFVSRRHAR